MTAYVRTVRAHEGETVEIQWRCHDGTAYITRYTLPPKPVRDAKAEIVSWGDTREKAE